MMAPQDIEIYLHDCGFPFEKIGEALWRVESTENKVSNIILSYADPVLVFRVNLMKVPQQNKETFYERLLQLNVSEILHGAFGIDNDTVVLIDTLQIANLDRNELQASVDSLGFTVAQYYQELKTYLR